MQRRDGPPDDPDARSEEYFGLTPLVDTNFQAFHVGTNLNGSPYYVFDYAAGTIASGGGGGLAYFLAVEITMAIAQVINFFTTEESHVQVQRKCMESRSLVRSCICDHHDWGGGSSGGCIRFLCIHS